MGAYMTAYWLTYAANPERFGPDEMRALVSRFRNNPRGTREGWSFSSYRSAQVGERVFLFKQGDEPRVVFGLGRISKIRPPTTPNGHGNVTIKFDSLVDQQEEMLVSLDECRNIFNLRPHIINTPAAGNSLTDDEANQLEAIVRVSPTTMPLRADDADEDDDGSAWEIDQRERSLHAITVRRGQQRFRAALVGTYGGRCAITECDLLDALEAAHIDPYLGDHTNRVENGLLLRSDIHVLFDCHMISVNPETRKVEIVERVKSSSYNGLDGKQLRKPSREDAGPRPTSLIRHYSEFRKAKSAR
jgi:putative restriction endonuclease